MPAPRAADDPRAPARRLVEDHGDRRRRYALRSCTAGRSRSSAARRAAGSGPCESGRRAAARASRGSRSMPGPPCRSTAVSRPATAAHAAMSPAAVGDREARSTIAAQVCRAAVEHVHGARPGRPRVHPPVGVVQRRAGDALGRHARAPDRPDPRRAGERWLDAACGPGLVARGLAARVGEVHGVDMTPAMVDVAREARREGLETRLRGGRRHRARVRGRTFDGAVTRFSLHHIPVPGRVVAELARVVRPGGAVVLADHVTSADADEAAWHEEIERLRDPSHWACLDAGAAARAGRAGRARARARGRRRSRSTSRSGSRAAAAGPHPA